MNERKNKLIKSVGIMIAVLMTALAVGFALSKFLATGDTSKTIYFNAYKIEDTEISLSTTDYTGDDVYVTITSNRKASANLEGTANSQRNLKIQYQIVTKDEELDTFL